MTELAQLLGSHHDLMRTAAAQEDHFGNTRAIERIERMRDDVRPVEFGAGLGEDPRDVERDVAHADDDCGLARQIRT